MYIGSSKSVTLRKYGHFNSLKKGSHHSEHLQKSYDKYGKDKFAFYIIEECDESKRVERETYNIELYKCGDREYGYNVMEVDGGSFKCSDETKRKISNTKTNKIPVDVYLTSGEFVKTFDCISSCSRELKLKTSTVISNILVGKHGRRSYKGFTFVKSGDPFVYKQSPKARDMSRFW